MCFVCQSVLFQYRILKKRVNYRVPLEESVYTSCVECEVRPTHINIVVRYRRGIIWKLLHSHYDATNTTKIPRFHEISCSQFSRFSVFVLLFYARANCGRGGGRTLWRLSCCFRFFHVSHASSSSTGLSFVWLWFFRRYTFYCRANNIIFLEIPLPTSNCRIGNFVCHFAQKILYIFVNIIYVINWPDEFISGDCLPP